MVTLRIQKQLDESKSTSEVGVGFSRPSFAIGSSVGDEVEDKVISGISSSFNNGVVVLTVAALVIAVPVIVVSVVAVVLVVFI